MKDQPAIKSYFFEKGYKDLSNTIKDSWSSNIASALDLFAKGGAREWHAKIVYFSAGLAVIIFGAVLFSVLSLLHIVLLFLVFLVIYISYTLVLAVDYLYRVKNKITTSCPNSGCFEKNVVPVYQCPNCFAEHDELWPGKFGILNRTCNCGAELPTTFLNGRNKLYASCPKCRKNLSKRFNPEPL